MTIKEGEYMIRPCKLRRVEGLPDNNGFSPLVKKSGQKVVMTVEEYETIRLIDYRRMTQSECAELMNTARTTVQKIYDEARFKIADAMINGKPLLIEGGNYIVYREGKPYSIYKERRMKNMIIAIPTNEKSLSAVVSRNLGRAAFVMFYDVDAKTAEFKENEARKSPGGAGITAGQFIIDNGANVVITPRCGENAYRVINGKADVFRSMEGSLEENVNAFLNNELEILTEVHKGLHNHG